MCCSLMLYSLNVKNNESKYFVYNICHFILFYLGKL